MSLPIKWMSAGHKRGGDSGAGRPGAQVLGHARVACGGGNADIVGERVEPDVSDVIGIEGQGNAPVQAGRGAANAKVFEDIVFEETEHFVAAIIRSDE